MYSLGTIQGGVGTPHRSEGCGRLAKNGVCHNPHAQRKEIPSKTSDNLD